MICAGVAVWHGIHGAAESWLEAAVQVLASRTPTDLLRGTQENSVGHV